MEKRKRYGLGFLVVAALLLSMSCNTESANSDDEEEDDSYLYALGDTGPAGGLIFYIDKEDLFDWTYLEVAPKSTEWTSKVWGGYGTMLTARIGSGIGSGFQNTIEIVNQFGEYEPYDNKADYAAKLCSDLVSGGYNDWFLPSCDELNLIWKNLADKGLGEFTDDDYWSSRDGLSTDAMGQDMGSGMQFYYNRKLLFRVRAVRAF